MIFDDNLFYFISSFFFLYNDKKAEVHMKFEHLLLLFAALLLLENLSKVNKFNTDFKFLNCVLQACLHC